MARKAAAQAAETPQIADTPTPLIGSVDVELEPEVAAPEEAVVETAPQPSEPAPQPAETPKPAEDPALLQRIREAEAAAQRNADIARQWKEHSEAKERERQQQDAQNWRRVYDAQYDSVVNTIGAAQSAIEAKTGELEAAYNNGETRRAAEIQVELGKLGGQMERLENQKGQMEQWLENQQRQPQQPRQQQPQQRQQQPQQQPQRPPTREEAIAGVDAWDGPPRAKQWLKDNLEYMTDPRKNAALQSVHAALVEQGTEQFSDDYYERMEAALLGRKANGNGHQQPANQSQPVRQAAPVSAPPTREAPSMSTGKAPVPDKITLNQQEQEVATGFIGVVPGITNQKEANQRYAEKKRQLIKEGRIGNSGGQ